MARGGCGENDTQQIDQSESQTGESQTREQSKSGERENRAVRQVAGKAALVR